MDGNTEKRKEKKERKKKGDTQPPGPREKTKRY